MRRLAVVSLLVGFVFVIGATSQRPPPELSAEDVKAIQELVHEHYQLMKSGDLDGLLNQYSEFAVEFLRNGLVVRGKNDIRNRWRVLSSYECSAMHDEILDLTGYGDTASVWVKYTWTFKIRPEYESATRTIVVLSTLRKVDGNWKYTAETWAGEQE